MRIEDLIPDCFKLHDAKGKLKLTNTSLTFINDNGEVIATMDWSQEEVKFNGNCNINGRVLFINVLKPLIDDYLEMKKILGDDMP